MTTAYTSLLGLALPVTGELSGTWGDTVNNYITQYLDSAVEGTQTISGSQTSVTLSVTNGTSLSQVGSGSTGSAQYAIVNCTGNPASTLTITAPASSREYIVINATSTSQSVTFRGAGPTTGVSIVSGERCIIAWNGSDFVKVASTVSLPAGSTTQVQYNNAGALAGSANMTFNGTRLTVADFADSSLTSGRVTYAGAGGNLTDSANLTFNGTTLSANALSLTTALTPANGGTGVANAANNTITFTGNFSLGLTLTGNTSVTMPTSGAIATKGNAIAFSIVFGL